MISLRTAGSGERRVFPEATPNDGTQPVTEPRMRGLELALSPRILAQAAELIEQRHYLHRADALPGFIVFGHHLDGKGSPTNPHDQAEVRSVVTVSDDADGLEATSHPLPGFPGGMLVMMNASGRNFLLYDWRNVIR